MTAAQEPIETDAALMSPAAVELLAKLIVLVAAMLPVAGVAIRLIAFLLDPYLRNRIELSVALPIVDLAALAAWALLVPVLSLLLTAWLARNVARDQAVSTRMKGESAAFVEEAETIDEGITRLKARLQSLEDDPALRDAALPEDFLAELGELQEQHEHWKTRYVAWSAERDRTMPRWLRFAWPLLTRADRLLTPVAAATRKVSRKIKIALAIVGLIVLALLLPDFPTLLILLPTSFYGQTLVFRRTIAVGDFRLRHVWPGVAVFLVGYVLASGITYTGANPANYRFTGATGVPDGFYAELGRTDDLVYLRSCARVAEGSIAVQSSAITLIELPPSEARPLQVSLLEVLQGKQAKLGTTGQCDSP